jgi:pimeloyl-ACP methyl ester carboxylesterase
MRRIRSRLAALRSSLPDRRKSMFIVAALLLLTGLSADVSLLQPRSGYDWRERVIVLLPGVCALPAQLPPAPSLPTLALLPPPPRQWPTWPGWLTCGGAHALQNASARALRTFVGGYENTRALTTALNEALHQAPAADGSPDDHAGLPFTIKAIAAFSYAGTAPTYESGQTRQPLADSARALDAQLQRWQRQFPGASFDLIGHSLGGAVAVYWAAAIATPARLRAIHSIITLDSPLGGIPHSVADALFAPFFGPVAQDLLAGSPAIQRMARAPERWLTRANAISSPLYTIANIRDLVVPFLWASTPGAVLSLDDYGSDSSSLNHGAILTSPTARAEIARILAQEGMPFVR